MVAKTNSNLLSCSLVSHKSNTGLAMLKSRCQQGRIPYGNSRGESISLPFPVATGLLHSVACDPLPPSSESATLHLPWILFLCLPLPLLRTLWLHWAHLYRFPISRVLIKSCLWSPFFSMGGNIHRLWGLGCGHLWGVSGHYSAYHTTQSIYQHI